MEVSRLKEDEAALLGQIMLHNDIYHQSTIGTDHFLREDNRRIFKAITKCINEGVYADLMAVASADEKIDKAYLAKLTDIGSTTNWKYYEGRIIKAWQLYRINQLNIRLGDVVNNKEDPVPVFAEIEKFVLEVSRICHHAYVEKIGDVAAAFMRELEERCKTAPGELLGLPSHLCELDRVTNGWKKRDLIYIGARPSEGKSALMLNFASFLAITRGEPCGIISMESSSKEIVKRLYISEGHIDGQKIARANLTGSDIGMLMDFSGTIYDKKLYLYDGTNINMSQLRSVARAMVAMYKIKILFVDYLQLIRGTSKNMGKTEVVGENSVLLKELARELEIPIVCLAQLGRPERPGAEPDLGSFQWASQIEQDADICLLIHHGEDGSWLLAKKVRDGECGRIPVHFHRDRVKFFPRSE